MSEILINASDFKSQLRKAFGRTRIRSDGMIDRQEGDQWVTVCKVSVYETKIGIDFHDLPKVYGYDD